MGYMSYICPTKFQGGGKINFERSLTKLFLSHWVFQIPQNWFCRQVYEHLEVCQGNFEIFDFSRNLVQISDQSKKKSLFFSFPGPLESPNIFKIYAATFEIFIWSVWADFRQKRQNLPIHRPKNEKSPHIV